MDPITAVGLVASIVQLIECTAKTIGYINHVNDAPKQRARLAREATILLSLLTDLRYRIDDADTNDPWFEGLFLLGGTEGPIDLFREDMEALAKKLKPETGLAKVGKRLVWPLDDKKIQEIINKIERLKTTINYALQKDIFRLTQAIKEGYSNIDRQISEVASGMLKLELSQENQNRLETTNWLSNLNFSAKQIDTFSRRQDGTGEWILRDDAFQSWLNGSKPVLWCPGIPGAGKTVLASFVVDHLEKTYMSTNEIAVTCIYCSYKEQENQSTGNLIASILKQLLQLRAEIPSEIVNLHQRHLTKQTRPTLDEISNLLKSEISSRKSVFIVVDALDELSENDNIRDNFISELRSIQGDVRLMITSRHLTTIEREFEQAGRIEILASDEDIKLYLKARILQERRLYRQLKDDMALQETIIMSIAKSAKGMFLLAQLHIDSLAKKQNKRDIRKALQNLPVKLDDTYNEAMQRIKAQDKEDVDLAKRVLSWITCALEPLTIYQLQHALAVELGSGALDEESLPDEDLLVSVCVGLVTIDQESKVIRLVHFTTQIYFERVRGEEFPSASMEIAMKCLTYLSFDIFTQVPVRWEESQLRELEKKYPFLDYAVQHWGDHARGDHEEKIKDMILDYLMTNRSIQLIKHVENSFKNWATTNIVTRSVFPEGFAFGSSAHFGLTHIAKHLIDQCDSDVNYLYVDKYTALHIAAKNGHEEMVRLLLMNGADVGARSLNADSALHVASTEAVVRLLLEYGAEINGKNSWSETALHKAVEYGTEDFLQLLLLKGADVNAKGREGDTPLHYAAKLGRDTMMKLLLGTDPMIDSTNDVGDTVLQTAIKKCQEPIVSVLLEKGANPNVPNLEGMAPLHISTAYKLYKTMRCLLDKGANLEAGDKAGQTVLYQSLGDEKAFRLLMEKGASIEAKDQEGLTVLHWTIKLWKESAPETVVLLLENGANIDMVENTGRTALHIAIENSNQSATSLLLDNGASIHSKDHDGQEALHIAAKVNNVSIMTLLFDSGNDKCDVNCVDNLGQTPLHRAAGLKHKWVWEVGSFLVQRQKVEEFRPCVSAVELLLEKEATVDARDNHNQTALLLAVQSTKHAIKAQIPTSRRPRRRSGGSEMSVAGDEAYRVSPLEQEIMNNARDAQQVLRLLIKHGADIEAESYDTDSPLSVATSAGLKLLLLEPDKDIIDDLRLLAPKRDYTRSLKLLVSRRSLPHRITR